jgi:hypothetical protein
VLLLGRPTTYSGAELVSVLTTTNLWLIGINLLPVPPLDGAEAWPLLKHARDAWRARRRRARRGKGSDSPRRGSGDAPAGKRPAEAPVNPEIADMLRRIADEAGRARRGN